MAGSCWQAGVRRLKRGWMHSDGALRSLFRARCFATVLCLGLIPWLVTADDSVIQGSVPWIILLLLALSVAASEWLKHLRRVERMMRTAQRPGVVAMLKWSWQNGDGTIQVAMLETVVGLTLLFHAMLSGTSWLPPTTSGDSSFLGALVIFYLFVGGGQMLKCGHLGPARALRRHRPPMKRYYVLLLAFMLLLPVGPAAFFAWAAPSTGMWRQFLLHHTLPRLSFFGWMAVMFFNLYVLEARRVSVRHRRLQLIT